VGMKNIFAITGSASRNSSNHKIIQHLADLGKNECNFLCYDDLRKLPHFDPDRSIIDPPPDISEFRKAIEDADGVLICTPEYLFSIPSGLKNALEWCVSTTVFSAKACGLITASTDGKHGHAQLQLLMKTLLGTDSECTTLLLPGIRSRLNELGKIKDQVTLDDLQKFYTEFCKSVKLQDGSSL
jgi:chromate reductase